MRICLLFAVLFLGCAHASKPQIEVDKTSAKPGTKVIAGGAEAKLYNEGKTIQVGKPIEPFLQQLGDDAKLNGQVAVVDVVPSVDTKV